MNSVLVKILALAVILSLMISTSDGRSLRHFKSTTFQNKLSRSNSFGRRPTHSRFNLRQGRGREAFRHGRQEEEAAENPSDIEPADAISTETESPLPWSYASDAAAAEAPQLSYGAPLGDTIDSYEGDLPGAGSENGSNGSNGSIGSNNSDGSNSSLQGDDDKERSDGSGSNGDIPPWCNPTDPMGAWLNFQNVRDWCIGEGFEELSPYGGSASEETTTEAVNADDRDYQGDY